MKLFLRHKENFHPETLDFYQKNFELTDVPTESDIIVINDFEPVKTALTPVACNSTGIDHIDAPKVISLRGEDLSDLTAVPELCLAMAIYCTRIFKGEEVRGKTLGLIGYGRIAKRLAKIASSVGMNVMIYDKCRIDWNVHDWAIDIDALCRNSDIVSLHITADEENRNFIDKEKFEKMKDGAIFLNSSRDWLVDQKDLYWALENKLSGAWVDFTIPYAENLVTTPHLGGSTKESRQKSEMIIAKKLFKLYGTA